MPLGDSYITTAELKTRLGITVSTFDTQLTEAASAASRSVEKYCNRQFNKVASGSPTARTYYPEGCRLIEADDFHTATGLVVKTDLGDDGTYETTWASTDYQLEPLNGVVGGETGWPYSRVRAVEAKTFPVTGHRAPVEVTAEWGWATVPSNVKEATLALAEELYKQKDVPFGVMGFAEMGVVRVKQSPYICRLLDPYRRYVLLVG